MGPVLLLRFRLRVCHALMSGERTREISPDLFPARGFYPDRQAPHNSCNPEFRANRVLKMDECTDGRVLIFNLTSAVRSCSLSAHRFGSCWTAGTSLCRATICALATFAFPLFHPSMCAEDKCQSSRQTTEAGSQARHTRQELFQTDL